MLAARAFPRHDIFSYNAAGQPWVNMEWLAQIILFWIYDWFGWRGLVLLCGLVITLAYNVTWTLLRPGSAAALHFDRSPGWRRLYADDVAVVHVRR